MQRKLEKPNETNEDHTGVNNCSSYDYEIANDEVNGNNSVAGSMIQSDSATSKLSELMNNTTTTTSTSTLLTPDNVNDSAEPNSKKAKKNRVI